MLWPMAAQAAQYYVSPSGNDSNNGSLNNPWQTLPYAFGRLVAGDVLYLRGGTYYLHDYYTSLKGTASAPITIQSYSGEHALVDGGLPDFKSTSTGGWELVNASLGLYRSKSSFSASFVRAWLLDYNAQIVEFSSAANMEATNYSLVSGFTPFYMGPGVQLRPDGHIYIRLQYNPYDLTDVSGSATSPSPGDTNPNKNRISIFTSEHILALVGAAYLHFKDIDFSYAKQIFDIRGGTHHIELDRCKLNFGSYGLVIRDNIHDWNVHDCEFKQTTDRYVATVALVSRLRKRFYESDRFAPGPSTVGLLAVGASRKEKRESFLCSAR